MRKKEEQTRYLSPQVELAQIAVECGFATSPGIGAAGGDGTLHPLDFGDL